MQNESSEKSFFKNVVVSKKIGGKDGQDRF